MSNLLYKELRLAAHPTLYIFTLLGALVIIPNYPYCTVFLYGCLAPYITLIYGRETNDIYYSALLPVKKRDVVKSKCMLMVVSQLAQIVVSIPFALLRVKILPDGNIVGIEANVAYYGFGLIIYAVFNAVFLTEFFKTAYKAGRAFVLAIIPAAVLMIVMEVLAHIPALAWIDSTNPEELFQQLPVLAFGIIVYILAMRGAYALAAERFEKVDL